MIGDTQCKKHLAINRATQDQHSSAYPHAQTIQQIKHVFTRTAPTIDTRIRWQMHDKQRASHANLKPRVVWGYIEAHANTLVKTRG